jgi:NADP-dependent 3-hydroxy acid dehydrogenase YdfG
VIDSGTAVVVGASSDIGRAIAVDLASMGLDVVAVGRDSAALAATVEASVLAGGRARAESLDVLDRRATAELVDRTEGRLRVAVWAAGVFDWAPAQTADPDRWSEVIGVNLTAAATFTATVLPRLVAAAPAALVYIGSTASRQAFAGNAAYVASKHGLAGLSRSTFLDVRDQRVKVSLVSPGLVAAGAGLDSPTGRERPQDLLLPADVAAAVRFVVSFPTRGCPVEVQIQPQRSG